MTKKIITIANQKGGVGKSTLALNLAYTFQNGLQVGLLDSDLQGSLYGLYAMIEGIKLIPATKNLSNLQKTDNDLIIVDSPPYLTDHLEELFAISDFILIPTKVGFFDVMAIKSTISLIEKSEIKNPNLRSGIVLNMVKPRTTLNNEIKKMLTDMGKPVFNTQVSDRVSYSRSALTGGVLKTEDTKAKEEMVALADEVLAALGL
jgi:chromosome partitioning protein